MPDITCSHCGEPWDVWGLKHESLGYLTYEQSAALEPLGTADHALTYIAGAFGTGHARDMRVAVTAVQDSDALENGGQPATVAALFRWCYDIVDPVSGPAKTIAELVQNAIFAAVANGQGCPSCGFAHSGIGQRREITMGQLLQGVDDTDPTVHLLYEERRS
jgi:hypothetical protein